MAIKLFYIIICCFSAAIAMHLFEIPFYITVISYLLFCGCVGHFFGGFVGLESKVELLLRFGLKK